MLTVEDVYTVTNSSTRRCNNI